MVFSDEWLLIKPNPLLEESVIGDTLIVQENTDVDSIFIVFGGGITKPTVWPGQSKLEFSAFKVLPTSSEQSKYKYSVKHDQNSLSTADLAGKFFQD